MVGIESEAMEDIVIAEDSSDGEYSDSVSWRGLGGCSNSWRKCGK